MFVGIDVHKDTHTAVGVSPFGEKMFEMTVGNYKKDFDILTKKVTEISGSLSPYFGLEDCHGYGERLSAYLYENGHQILAVPSIMVDRDRQKATHPEKSDSLDAFGVAKVMMNSIDSLPAYTISEESKKSQADQGIVDGQRVFGGRADKTKESSAQPFASYLEHRISREIQRPVHSQSSPLLVKGKTEL